MRYARAVVVLGGALVSFAYLLIGLRGASVPVDSMVFDFFPLLGPPVLLATVLVSTGRAFRIYAVLGVVAAVAIGTYVAASPRYGFPRSMLALALTYALAAALPTPPDRLPRWLTPTALVAGAAIVFALITPA
jgi:uncharacterized membrane protein YccC